MEDEAQLQGTIHK